MKASAADHRDRLDAHIFVCTNSRGWEYACCADAGGEETVAAIKSWLRERDAFWSPIAATETDCLGLCSEGGTAISIQPQDEWYSDVRPADVPSLLESTVGSLLDSDAADSDD